MAVNAGGAGIALLLGLLILVAPLLLAITAIASGVVARRRIARSGGELRGTGLATAGIVLGAVSLFVTLGVIAVGVVGAVATQRRVVTTFAPAPAVSSPPTRVVPRRTPMGVEPAEADPFEEEPSDGSRGGGR